MLEALRLVGIAAVSAAPESRSMDRLSRVFSRGVLAMLHLWSSVR